ncbi:hypothetical protein P4050_06805 [Pseudomonas aeruginosa]|nr:hypothetical protein [Pseudomonas aeruginosa]
MLTPSDISKRLADRAADVARHLLPGGKREGAEWRAGDASGEKGKSLGVHLVGEKAGVWCDFATGESGDLLDLWRLARNCDMATALSEARGYLGVQEPSSSGRSRAGSHTSDRTSQGARRRRWTRW